MANIGELPYVFLGTAPKFGLQTTSQKEIFYGGVRTGCKEKRAGRSKFVAFSFIYWAHCRRRRACVARKRLLGRLSPSPSSLLPGFIDVRKRLGIRTRF